MTDNAAAIAVTSDMIEAAEQALANMMGREPRATRNDRWAAFYVAMQDWDMRYRQLLWIERCAKRLTNNLNEFGCVTDEDFLNDLSDALVEHEPRAVRHRPPTPSLQTPQGGDS